MEVLDTILENASEPLYTVTLFVALMRYQNYYSSPLKYFPVLLAYTLLTELLGFLTMNYDEFQISIFTSIVSHNVFIYNIYNLVFFNYFFYVYWCYLKDKKSKSFILYGAIFFLIISIINLFFQNFKFESQVYSYITGAILILFCTVLFLWEYFRSSKKLDYKDKGMKWISIGLFIFHLGYGPIKISRYYNYLNQLNELVHVRRIHLTLIILMYICFIIGFLKMKRKFWI